MTWSFHHGNSEKLAEEAHHSLRQGDEARAVELFRIAAEEETLALNVLGEDKPRTLGITAVSAAVLWYRSGDALEAARVAHSSLSRSWLPDFAASELRSLLQTIWNESAMREAGLEFLPGQVIVSIQGGEIVHGGAPLDLIVDKVNTVQSLFFRTVEYFKAIPLRKSGPPSKEIKDRCRPWLFQSVPGSYQFAVAVQKPKQQELFPSDGIEPEAVTEKFLAILQAATLDPHDGLSAIVPDKEYRDTFLKMTRNLAPTGKVFERMEIRGFGDRDPVILSPSSRREMSETLRVDKVAPGEPSDEVRLQGVLVGLQLQEDWLDVTVDGKTNRIFGVGETVDDLIGPMVNQTVIVRAAVGKKGRLKFLDIEQEE